VTPRTADREYWGEVNEELLRNTAFVRSLARRLIADPHAADDVAQETLIAAWNKPPTSTANLRGWLAAVTRNLAARHHRSRGRRASHEGRAPRKDPVSSPPDDIARLEAQRQVVDATLALAPLYREVVVRRYLDGKSPRQIARELGVPVATVKTRLKRALQMLRGDLDTRNNGSRKAWMVALAPLAWQSASTASAATLAASAGVWIMSLKTKAALAVVLLAAGAATIGIASRSGTSPPVRRDRSEPVVAAVPDSAPQPQTKRAPNARSETPTGNLRVQTNVPGATVTIRFHFFGGAPNPPPLVRTADDRGVVLFDPPPHEQKLHHVAVEAVAPDHGRARGMLNDGAATLELKKGQVVTGKVVDPEGRPVSEVQVGALSWDQTDEQGRFLVSASPDKDGIARIYVSRSPAFLAQEKDVRLPATDLTIVLERGETIAGRVTFEDGSPAPGVWMSADRRRSWTMTDERGEYVLSALAAGEFEVSFHPYSRYRPPHWTGGSERKKTFRTGVTNADWVINRNVIRVRVLDEKGLPFRFATVSLSGRSSWDSSTLETDADGRATFLYGQRKGSLVTQAPGCLSDHRELTFGSGRLRDIEIRLTPIRETGSIALDTRNDRGEPLRSILLTLTHEGGPVPDGFLYREVALDASGRARIEGIPPAKYTAQIATSHWVSTEGYELPQYVPVEVRPAEVAPVDARLVVGGRVRVTVRNRQGKIVAPMGLKLKGSWVYFTPASHEKGRSVSTPLSAREAYITGTPVKPGRYELELIRGAARESQEVLVEAGKTTEVELTVDD
jgi:RNA polymerase sigma-70 factor (ECF subfamily)